MGCVGCGKSLLPSDENLKANFGDPKNQKFKKLKIYPFEISIIWLSSLLTFWLNEFSGRQMTEDQRGRGRPKGKRSDPSYTTLTAYIKVSTFKALKKRCVDLDMEISEAIQQILDDWLDH